MKVNSIFIQSLALILVISFFTSSYAKKKKRRRAKTQYGVVKIDGAAVYKKPSFDSSVLDYLSKGKKVLMSKKIYRGTGNMGTFYRIKLSKKRYGYIVDTEILVRGKRSANTSSSNRSKRSKSSGYSPREIFFSKLIGGGINFINYTETFEGQKLSSMVPSLAFKMTAPRLFLISAPVDVEVSVSPQVPEFFDRMSHTTSGFLFHSNFSLMYPLVQFPKGFGYAHYGITGVMEKFSVEPIAGDALDSWDLKFGLKLGAGLAYILNSYVLKAEVNYYYESSQYISAGIYLQKVY